MPIVHCVPAWTRVRPWLSAMVAVALLLVALAGPAMARQPMSRELAASDRPARLREAGVAPRLARTSTAIHFWVTFRDPSGAAPTWVRVLIDGHPRTMIASGAVKDYRLGVRFAYAGTLQAGSHRIRFRARSADGTVVATGGGAVKITRRSSSGGGSGPSDSGSGSTGAGSFGSRGSAGPTPAGSADPGTGSTGSTPDGPDASGPDPASAPADPPPGAPAGQAGDAAGLGRHRPQGDLALLADAAVDGVVTLDGERGVPGPSTVSPGPAAPVGSVDSDPGGAGGANDGGAAPRGLEQPAVGRSLFDQVFRAYPVLITTSGTAVVWAGFVIFGRRRRDGDPLAPDPVLASNAATAPAPVPFTELVPSEAHPLPVPPGVDPSEAGLPRWRRPSLLQARKTDPLRTASTAVSLTFADGAVVPDDGMERRRIRYRLVRLLDVPDELRANEIGILDEGDEVQLLEALGTYWLVLCPDGQQGWLHKMVLGDLVADGERSIDLAPAGIDEDVLAAFIATRRKTA